MIVDCPFESDYTFLKSFSLSFVYKQQRRMLVYFGIDSISFGDKRISTSFVHCYY